MQRSAFATPASMAELRPYPSDMAPGLRVRLPVFKARCHVKSLFTLHKVAVHAVAVFGIGVLGLITVGCDDPPVGVPLVNGADFRPGVSLAPLPITFEPFGALPCAGGFVFDPSFHLIVSAGVGDVTLDSVTLHMIDGSNFGGASVTIPRPELTTRFGSTLINAGTSRDFALRPDFGCIARPPTALRGSALLLDRRGLPQTVIVQGRMNR